MTPRVLFVSRERFRLPLDGAQRRKWDAVGSVVDHHVLAAAPAGSPTHDERFQLVPPASPRLLDGALFYFLLPWRIGRALRRDRPGFIAGLERSIALLTSNPLEIRPLAPLDAHLTGIRCNDGKCDAQGRFWIGTCDTAFHEATGWFFRFDAAGALMRTVGPFICTNGPAFSPDGTRIYCVDSYGKVVYQYAMSPTGDLGAPTVFQRFDREDWGYPDGLTCDLAGCVWIAHWGASKVSRFSPQGELLDVIHLPVAQPTSCTFGGPELKRLFITSASQGLSAASNANGLAGAVFAVDLEVGGLRAARFAG